MILSSSTGAKIIYPGQKITPIHPLSRIKSVAKTFAISGGMTLASSVIPILHFVTVPIGLIVTTFLTYSSYKKNYHLKNFEVHCPHCDQKSVADVVGVELPLRTFCGSCRHLVYLNN